VSFFSTSPPRPDGSSTVDLLPGGIVRVCFSGHVSAGVVERALDPSRALVEGRPHAVLFDTIGVTSFDPSVRSPGFELLSLFRQAGITIATAAVASQAVRMMGSAIAFGAGLPLEFFVTFEEAHARAKELVEKMPRR
jgi:hypothetical protein